MPQLLEIVNNVQREIGQIQWDLVRLNYLATRGKVSTLKNSNEESPFLMTCDDRDMRNEFQKKLNRLDKSFTHLLRCAESELCNARFDQTIDFAKSLVGQANLPSLIEAINGIELVITGFRKRDYPTKLGPELKSFLQQPS